MSALKPFGLKMRRVLILIFLALITVWNMALSTRRQYYSGIIVQTQREDVSLTVRCPGKIEPRVQETVRSLIRGKKKKVYVNEGDSVKKGDLLVEISDEEIRRELTQKKNAFDNSRTDLSKAQKELALARSLFRKGAIPRREVDDARQSFTRTQQSLDLAREDFSLTQEKAKGTRVVSPIAGVVLKIFITEKDDISEKDDLIKVAQLDDLILRGQVDELDISEVKPPQEASIVCDAFPGTEMPGAVTWVGAQAKEGAFADVEVILDIKDMKGLQLIPNTSCKASIVTGQIPHAVVIPANAVKRGPKGTYVLKAQWGGWLKEQPVEVKRVTSETTIVLSGINAGESILAPKPK